MKNLMSNSEFTNKVLKREAYRAFDILTISEKESISGVLKNIEGYNVIINFSKISNKMKFTRTTLANAIKKLKYCGILEAVSRGPQGTDITIINEEFIKILKNYKCKLTEYSE